MCALSACAGSGEEQKLDAMREEIDHITSSRDEVDQAAFAAGTSGSAASAGPGLEAMPPPPAPLAGSLQAITIGSDEQEPADDYADTEDSSPRPSIRILGSPRTGRGAWREDQVERTSPDQASPSATGGGSARLDPAAKSAYDAALALVAARKYPEALDALAAFLMKWPDHPYADNALYWRGEAYYARGEYARAADQFEGVITRFPGGNKVPDALLKLGLCYRKLGDPSRAQQYLDRLAQQYPQSDAARHIPPAPVGGTPPNGPSPQEHP